MLAGTISLALFSTVATLPWSLLWGSSCAKRCVGIPRTGTSALNRHKIRSTSYQGLKAADAYQAFVLPTQVFIDADGVVRQVLLGKVSREQAEAIIEPLLEDEG